MNNLDKEYKKLLIDIKDNGTRKIDRTGTGTLSVFGRMIRINMKEGFPLLTTKKIHTRSVIHELLWFLNGDTNTKYLNNNSVTIWNEWANEKGDLGPIYGKQWVDWNGINQIQYVIDRLLKYPDCRRIMVNAWNVGELDTMALMPCHYGFQFWTRELSNEERYNVWFVNNYKDGMIKKFELNKMPNFNDSNFVPTPNRGISLSWNQRSCDTFLGIPFNIASYALLLEMIAQQVNMIPEELIGFLGDVHLYSNHMEQVKIQLERNSKQLPKLKLNKAKSIFDYKFENFEFVDYKSHPTIKAPISI